MADMSLIPYLLELGHFCDIIDFKDASAAAVRALCTFDGGIAKSCLFCKLSVVETM